MVVLKLETSEVGSKLLFCLSFSLLFSFITYLLWRKKLPKAIIVSKDMEIKRRKLLSFLSSKNFKSHIVIFKGKSTEAFSTQLFESQGSIYIPEGMIRDWPMLALEGVVLHESYHLKNKDPLKKFVRSFVAFFFFFSAYFFFEKWLMGVMALSFLGELVHNRLQEYRADEFAYGLDPRRAKAGLYALGYEMNKRVQSAQKKISWTIKGAFNGLYNLFIVHGLYSLYLAYEGAVGMHPSVNQRLKHLKEESKDIRKTQILLKTKGLNKGVLK